MNEFLYHNAGYIVKFLELLAAIVGSIYFYKYKASPAKYFVFFLWYIFFLELIGGYTVYVYKYEWLADVKEYLSHTWMRRNNWWYTLFWGIGSALFYSFYFRKFLNSKILKSILKYISIIFIIFAFTVIASKWEAFFVTVLPKITVFGTVLIILSISFYLIEILKSDRILKFHKTLNVYISISVLMWTVITAPLAFFARYFIQEDFSYVYLRNNVVFFANVFLYTTFIIGLIVSKPEHYLSNNKH